ncbi:MAG: hypothetical protein WA632_06130 [Gallionella sp.]
MFLLFILFSAVKVGVAEMRSLSAFVTMDYWRSTSRFPTAEEIEEVEVQLETARDLANNDPEIHENLARLSLMRAAAADTAPAEKISRLRTGLSEIRIAIALRPASPYSWAILSTIKRDLGEYDSEFRQSLHRAVELGPWEPDLLTSLADVGLSAWPKMPPDEQELIQHVFVRGMEHQSKSMEDVAKVHRNECAGKAGITCQ